MTPVPYRYNSYEPFPRDYKANHPQHLSTDFQARTLHLRETQEQVVHIPQISSIFFLAES